MHSDSSVTDALLRVPCERVLHAAHGTSFSVLTKIPPSCALSRFCSHLDWSMPLISATMLPQLVQLQLQAVLELCRCSNILPCHACRP
jgi:hypothetical protein